MKVGRRNYRFHEAETTDALFFSGLNKKI